MCSPKQTNLGLIWLQGILPGSLLFPRAREPRAELAPGDPPRHLDASVREVALPDPRRFHGETFHASRGQGEKPRLERDRERSDRKATTAKIQSSASEFLRQRPERRTAPSLRCSAHQRLRRPWSSPSSFPGSTVLLEVPAPPVMATATVPRSTSTYFH